MAEVVGATDAPDDGRVRNRRVGGYLECRRRGKPAARIPVSMMESQLIIEGLLWVAEDAGEASSRWERAIGKRHSPGYLRRTAHALVGFLCNGVIFDAPEMREFRLAHGASSEAAQPHDSALRRKRRPHREPLPAVDFWSSDWCVSPVVLQLAGSGAATTTEP